MSGIDIPHAWHADEQSLRRWVDGTAGTLLGASVEQHVVRCEACRGMVARMVAMPSLDGVWDRVLDDIETPRPLFVERILVRLGLPRSQALLVASAPSMRLSWLGGITAALMFVVLAGAFGGDRGLSLFLLVAPLIPVAGVAASYGPSADPSYEATAVTPYPMLRLVLFRTAAVLVTCLPLVALSSLLPVGQQVTPAWLLPAVGFVAITLLASTWVDTAYAAAVVALSWLVAVVWWTRAGDPLGVLAPELLVAYAITTVLVSVALVVRLRSLGLLWQMP